MLHGTQAVGKDIIIWQTDFATRISNLGGYLQVAHNTTQHKFGNIYNVPLWLYLLFPFTFLLMG